MNPDHAILLLAALAVFFVWLPTYLTYRRKYIALKHEHRAELDKTFFSAFRSGYDAGYERQEKEAAWNRLMERKQKFPNNR